MAVQEHFIAYCRCREAVNLFRFLLSPYSLIGTCNSVQICTFRDSTGIEKRDCKATAKPVLNGIHRVQNIFPLKPGLIEEYYDSHRT
jgi:hypothetical protein